MADDPYRNGFEEEDQPTMTPEQVAEEAKAEEEFISAPEDTVENPLVPEEKKEEEKEDDDDENVSLEGAIGSGNLESDYPETAADLSSNEQQYREATSTEAETSTNEVASEPAEAPVLAAGTENQAVVPEQPVQTIAQAAEEAAKSNGGSKRKSRKGLIIGLCIAAFLLIGGAVAAIIWISAHESADKTISDALSGVLKADNITISANDVGHGDSKANVTLVKSGGNISLNGKAEIDSFGEKAGVDVSAAYIKGGKAYVKVNNLKDIFSGLTTIDSNDKLGSSMSQVMSILEPVIDVVDGKWISVTADQLKSVNSDASCALESIDGVLSESTYNKIAESYKKNSFLVLDESVKVTEKSGVKYYTVKIDEAKKKAFIKDIKTIDSMKKLAQCMDKDDSENSSSDDSAIKGIRLGIKPWSHELVSFTVATEYVDDDGEKKTNETTALVGYDKGNVIEPSDSSTIEELVTSLTQSIEEKITSIVSETCNSAYGSLGQEYVDACIEAAGEQIDMEQLLPMMLGGMLGNTTAVEDI